VMDEPGGGSSWGAGRTASAILRSQRSGLPCGKLAKLGLGRASPATAVPCREHPRNAELIAAGRSRVVNIECDPQLVSRRIEVEKEGHTD
jgi:hypothetical protein